MAAPSAADIFRYGGAPSPSWGPPEAPASKGDGSACQQSSLLEVLPFDLNLKSSLFSQQLFRCCDFTFTSKQRDSRLPVMEEEKEFHTVDSKPAMRHKAGGEGWLSRRRAPLKQTTAAFNEKTKEEEELKLGKKAKSDQRKQQQQQQARYARIHARHRAFSEWSVQPTNDWTLLAEMPLQQLHKQQIDTPSKLQVEDITWRGSLGVYSKQADRISSKLPVPMQNLSSNYYYYWVSTQDDGVIRDYLLNGAKPVDVAATDQILACLMSAPQSRYSWHLNLTKIEEKIIIDKAPGSIVDVLTVNETSNEPPMQDAESRINRPAALGYEAVKINQNIRQQLLLQNETAAEFEKPPFVEEGDSPATVAYRYRLFTVPPRVGPGVSSRPINVLTRAEVFAKSPVARGDLRDAREGDSFMIDGGGYIYICALNEVEPKGQKSWRTLLETQRGALLATEVRNNACKLRKFVTSAMIAGCDELRLGFVARKNQNDNEQHVILTVQNYQTRDLGRQIGLRPENAWGLVRAFVDLLEDKPDGRYVLLKDPTKPVMRLYSRPDKEVEQEEGNEAGREEAEEEV